MTEVCSTLTILNKKGLHARAAASLVKQAERFKCDIWVEKDGQKVSGRSIMGLMMLVGAQGTQIKITCNGKDAPFALDTLVNLVNSKFGEDE